MFGLIGGLGVKAGVYYYERLVAMWEPTGEAVRLTMAHAEPRLAVPLVQAGDRSGLAAYLASFARELGAGGAQAVAVAAVTPHLCVEELMELSPVPLINLLTVTDEALKGSGVQRIALIGTRYVIESDFFGALTSVDVVRPRPSETDEIHAIYFRMALSGVAQPDDRANLTRIATTLLERERLDAVLLAGTDLSLVFGDTPAEFPSLDCSQFHLEAILRSAREIRAP